MEEDDDERPVQRSFGGQEKSTPAAREASDSEEEIVGKVRSS